MANNNGTDNGFKPNFDLVEELTWRGMIHDIMPETKAQLNKERTVGYVGFDPTADSLHVGSLVPIMLLVHLQRAGHKPVALVGGATGLVGDPSGKSEERNLLSVEELNHNLAGVEKQLKMFLNFDDSPTGAEMANNYDWFKNMSFLDFIRDVGKHITVNYMMSKDSVKSRMDTGMSYTEFAYQLVQGYDFFVLNKEKGCKLQMGGSDQWGNITTGTELIRRKGGGEAFALTCPLIKKADGSKFGKSEKGNVWLDPEKTSGYDFYQFWIKASDADAESYIKIFTLLDQPTVEALIAKHNENPGAKELQKELAKQITTMVHGEEGYQKALETTQNFFSKDTSELLRTLSPEEVYEAFSGATQIEMTREEYNNLQGYPHLFSGATNNLICKSNGEARRKLKEGALKINDKKIDESSEFNLELAQDKYAILNFGKKKKYLVIVE